MKRLYLPVFILIIFSFIIGCDSDSDYTPPDTSAINPFVSFGGDLNQFLLNVGFGMEDHTEDPNLIAMLNDINYIFAYSDPVYDNLEFFVPVTAYDNTYTDQSRDNVITIEEGIFTFRSLYIDDVEPGQFEYLTAILTWNPTTARWVMQIFRGSTTENLWIHQEGAVVADTWYVTHQRINLDVDPDPGKKHHNNLLVVDNSRPADVLLNISGKESIDVFTPGTLYSDGITDANDEWSEFAIFELAAPDYQVP